MESWREGIIAFVIVFATTSYFNWGVKKHSQKIIAIFGNTCLHIHHWLTALVVMALIVAYDNASNNLKAIVLGALGGYALEGLTLFDDALKIATPCRKALRHK